MSHAVETTIANDLNELKHLADTAGGFLRDIQASDRTIYVVNLVLEETLSNVIKYAFNDAEEHQIDVRFRADEDSIVIRIEDDGRQFDPDAAPRPDLDTDLDERRVGGLGLHMVRNVARDLHYERADGRNHLTITVDRARRA